MDLINQILEFIKNDYKGRQSDSIDSDSLVANFSDSQEVRTALNELKRLEYINVIYADDKIYAIFAKPKLKNLD